MYDAIKTATSGVAESVVAFAEELVRMPSLSGEEEMVAKLIFDEMTALGYDEVFIDGIGNVVGIIRGSQFNGPSVKNVLYNCHMDHVDPGRLDAWGCDPYGANVSDGYMYGRATSDIKGAIAAQVYGAAILKRAKLQPQGNVIVTAVVQEEPAEAFGTRYLCDVTLAGKGVPFHFVVLGEPTDLNIALGHRGRVELEVLTLGRTSHGSAPWRGINAVYKMVPVLAAVQQLEGGLPADQFLGRSTIAPTIIGCSPGRLSIIPDLCTLSLDRRFLPSESIDSILAEIRDIFSRLEATDPEFKGEVRVREVEEVSYTGLRQRVRKLLVPWVTADSDPNVTATVEALRNVGQNPNLERWDFGTDGSHTAGVLGIPTIGYGPGEEETIHTPFERIKVVNIIDAVAGNAAIALAVAGGD